MTKYLMIALAVLALALGGTGWALKRQIGKTATVALELKQERTQAQEAAKALKRSQALSARLAKEKAATARSAALARQQLDRALLASPEWAQQAVPPDVQKAINESETQGRSE